MYGAAFFIAVYVVNRLAAKLIGQEELAAQRGRELQLQEAINRLVLADMGDGILTVGRNGEVVGGNPAAERMLGHAFSTLRPYDFPERCVVDGTDRGCVLYLACHSKKTSFG